MNLNLNNKVIIVTGGAKGIGEAICQVLSEEGAVPVIVGRNQEDNMKLESQIKQKGRQAYSIVAELTNHEQCANAIGKTVERFSRIDGLVNNAGVNDGISLEQGCIKDFMASIERNLAHYYLMAHLALPYLKASRGSILNIGSKTAETGQGGTSGYAASNGGRNALTREWAVELLPYGIRVNAIIVAECDTPQYSKWIRSLPNPEETLQTIEARIPFENRMTTSREIASAAAFLLSGRSSHTTGQLLHIDGGYVHLDRALLGRLKP